MNREKFLSILSRKLKKISFEDRQDILDYYNEYFDDAGIENEQQVIEELGAPAKLAVKLRGDLALKSLENKDKGKRMSILSIVLLSIFATPIALPLALGIAILAVAVILTIFILLIALGMTGVCLIISGLLGIVAAFSVVVISPQTTLFFVGTSFVAASLGVLLGIGIYVLTLKWIKTLRIFAAYLLEKGRKK